MKLNKLAVCCALALPVLYGCNSNDSSDNTVVPPPSVTLEFETIPTVRNWEATEGSYQVTANSRIVINPGNTESTLAGITTNISDTAEKFQETILAVTGLNLTIETSDTLRNGDISLTLLGNENDELGPEGYKLKVGDTVEIEANTNTGLFYGTQTILQLLQQDDEKSRIARGEVTDYPSLTERGIMVDAGRKYWEVDSLKDVIRQMGWMKMNRLHLHLTEWNAFRLDSDNPELEGLAALRAYTREDIAELEAVAKLNHVVIVPEIDIPGHGKMLSDFRKDAAFECPSMSVVTGRGWEGEHGPRWNLDYTGKSANSPRSGREFMFGLIEEFAPWFSGPYFHIGTDEVPEWGNLTSCAELASYVADSDHLREIGDPLVEFINEANDVIKGLGKQTQKWNWYERSPISFDADNDIRIDAWIGNALDYYTEKGYNTTLTGTPYLYLTPGFPNTMPNPPKIYTLEGSASPDMTGVKLSLWADTAYKWPDQQLEKLMVTPRTVTAERNWFGAHEDDSTFDEFLERMDTIGGAPLVVGEASAVPRDNWSVMAVSSEEIQRGDGGASNLFSGRTDSLWETRHSAGYDTYPHTVDIDMGDTYEVVGARFHPRQNGADRLRGLIGTYSFYVSEDGETWKMIVGSSEKDGSFSYPGNYVGRDKKAKTIHFEMEKARYFRFVAESPFEEGSRWASLAEIDIFGNKVGDEPVTVPESTYHIRSKADLSTCMRVDREEGDVANNDSMKMGKCLNTDDYQEWLTVDEGVVDGINYVSIRPVNTPDQCLDVNFNTGGLVTWDCHLGDNQLFRVHEDQYRYGYSTIKPKSAGNCMTISGDNNDDVAEGDRVSFSGCSDTNKKQWVLVP